MFCTLCSTEQSEVTLMFSSLVPWDSPMYCYNATAPPHYCCCGFISKLVLIGWSCQAHTQLVLNSVLFFSYWLPPKATDPSLPCYLTRIWGERDRDEFITFLTGICAIVNATNSARIWTLHANSTSHTDNCYTTHIFITFIYHL